MTGKGMNFLSKQGNEALPRWPEKSKMAARNVVKRMIWGTENDPTAKRL